MSELDVIGTLLGTDKCSSHARSWDYLRYYEDLFAPWRQSQVNLIEIGVAGGASLKLWQWFFEKATIVGIDIDTTCRRCEDDRIKIKIGSQEDPSFLQEVSKLYPPSIIIDDGSHLAHHMIASFEALFPSLLPGGLYVFEDMSFHFEDSVRQWKGSKAHQGLSDKSVYEYLSPFIRARAANITSPNGSWGFEKYAFENISSVALFGGVIAFRKAIPRDFALDVAIFDRELRQAPTAGGRERYAHYLVKHDVYRERAVDLLRDLLNYSPNNSLILFDLLLVLQRLDRYDEAADIASEITRLEPENKLGWQSLAKIQQKRKRPDLELHALETMAAQMQLSSDVYLRLSALYEGVGNAQAALTAAHKASAMNPRDLNLASRVKSLEARRQNDG